MVGLKGWLTTMMLGAGLGGCTSQLPLDHSPCPCPGSLGYVCCDSAGTRSCIRPAAGETCSPNPVIVDAGSDEGDGGTDAGSDAPLVTSRLVAIAVGRAHACIVREDHSISCVGDNSK